MVWCKYRYGEEGIDWEVRHISTEKGKGVVALKDIPKGTKIMVEKLYSSPNAHPAIADLEPSGGTLEQKFALNALGSAEDGIHVCLKFSRVNHSCGANSFYNFLRLPTKTVIALVARQDIKAGEEITICYTNWDHPIAGRKSLESHKELLQRKWKIVCPPSCPCNNPAVDAKLDSFIKTNEEMIAYKNAGDYATACSIAVRMIEELEAGNHFNALIEAYTLVPGYLVHLKNRDHDREMQYVLRCETLLLQTECEESLPQCRNMKYFRAYSKLVDPTLSAFKIK